MFRKFAFIMIFSAMYALSSVALGAEKTRAEMVKDILPQAYEIAGAIQAERGFQKFDIKSSTLWIHPETWSQCDRQLKETILMGFAFYFLDKNGDLSLEPRAKVLSSMNGSLLGEMDGYEKIKVYDPGELPRAKELNDSEPTLDADSIGRKVVPGIIDDYATIKYINRFIMRGYDYKPGEMFSNVVDDVFVKLHNADGVLTFEIKNRSNGKGIVLMGDNLDAFISLIGNDDFYPDKWDEYVSLSKEEASRED